MNPHYVLCSVDKLNLVIYCFDGSGVGSTLLHHWVAFPIFFKINNKERSLMEAKNQKDSQNVYKGK